MTRKPPKHTPGVRYPDSTRRAARKIYLTEGASDREIAERVGVKRIDTIRDWRTRENWSETRDAVAERATEKTVERLADSEADVNARHYRMFKNLEALGSAYLASHMDQATGTLRVPDAKEFRDMTTALRNVQQGMRLAMGLPDKVSEERRPKDTPPDLSAMSDAELLRRAGLNGSAPGPSFPAAPVNGTGRLVN